MAKETIYVIGHKSPDTDTACSSIAYAEYLKKKEKANAIAAICGDLNPETEFVLDYFKVQKPKKLENVSGKTLVLMDHNEKIQMPDGADSAKIVEIVDHHKIAFDYPEPIKFRTEPAGSTATIVAKIMLADKFKITKPLAGILLSAILSDTVVFKSATATADDIKIAKILAKTAKIKNLKNFGIEIKKQKASLKGLSAEKILHSDYKEFESKNGKFAVGQIEAVDLDEVKARRAEIKAQMEKNTADNNLVFTALMITDIINCGTLLLAAGDNTLIKKAFPKTGDGRADYIPGMMSRKKDLLPPLLKAAG